MAQIALPLVPVVCQVADLVLGRSMPANGFLGDEAVRVFGAHEAVDIIAGDAGGFWAAAGLNVVGNASGSREGCRAEGALNVAATMDGGV